LISTHQKYKGISAAAPLLPLCGKGGHTDGHEEVLAVAARHAGGGGISATAPCKDRGPRRGVELGLFQISIKSLT